MTKMHDQNLHNLPLKAEVLKSFADIKNCSLLVDPDAMVKYTRDWTGRWTGTPSAVLRPASFSGVLAAINVCRQNDISIVPQGGNTGLVAGTVAPPSSVIISAERLTDSGPIQPDGTVAIGAGTTLANLERQANTAGLTCGLTLASGESATVGGAVATNAGGMRVLRHGSARSRIAGLRAITYSGSVIDRRRYLPKDNTGFNLVDLLAGSEGTLAFITDVTWKLVRKTTSRVVCAFSFHSVLDAAAALPILKRLPGLEALEWSSGAEVARVSRSIERKAPLPVDGFWVFAELGSFGTVESILDDADHILAQLESVNLTDDRVAVATTAGDCRQLWEFRERITETINAEAVPIKLDVGVPIEVFADMYNSVISALQMHSAQITTALFGHLAEGNFHVNILPKNGGRISTELATELENIVLEVVLAYKGTVSAEHGVGRVKRKWVRMQHGADELELMRCLKHSWDPSFSLNPGVLFDPRP